MLLSDLHLLGVSGNEIFVKIISLEGQIYSTYFPENALVEEVKLIATEFFYPNETSGGGSVRFKLVRVSDGRTLHEFYTLQQEHVTEQEELLLLERGAGAGGGGAGALWELGSLRAPAPAAVAAATARLPAPRRTAPHPNLQSLLSTNEMTKELRKILISLIEAGARLAAGGRHYEATLGRLCAALEEPPEPHASATPASPSATTSSLDLIGRLHPPPPAPGTLRTDNSPDMFKRAECLQDFLDKFRAWRSKMHNIPNSELISTIKDIGFSEDEANTALQATGCNEPAAALWLVGERGSSIFELINGLPDGVVLQALLKQAVVQRGLLNTRMLIAFIAMVGQKGSAALWLNAPHGGPLLQQILRTYHAEKYCLAVNQYSGQSVDPATPSSSRRN